MKEQNQMIRHRLQELADRSFQENRYFYTGFLGMSELSVYHSMRQELSFVPTEAFGGTGDCERCIVRFGSVESCGYSEPYPIRLLKIEPLQDKFADRLNHRDFLGSVLGLGLEREKIGDIFIVENCGYIFVHESVAEYVRENLNFVKHTRVRVLELSEAPELLAPKLTEESVVVSGNRVDSVIARLYHLSREEAKRLILGEQVFLNGCTLTQGTRPLREGDIVSVRHYGRFRFIEEGSRTKKDRLNLKLQVYQ